MSDDRFNRLDDKVDKLQEDLVEVKAEMKIHMAKVDERIEIDKEIFNEMSPILDEFGVIAEIVQDYQFEKLAKAKRHARYKSYSIYGSLISLVVGTFYTLTRLF